MGSKSAASPRASPQRGQSHHAKQNNKKVPRSPSPPKSPVSRALASNGDVSPTRAKPSASSATQESSRRQPAKQAANNKKAAAEKQAPAKKAVNAAPKKAAAAKSKANTASRSATPARQSASKAAAAPKKKQQPENSRKVPVKKAADNKSSHSKSSSASSSPSTSTENIVEKVADQKANAKNNKNVSGEVASKANSNPKKRGQEAQRDTNTAKKKSANAKSLPDDLTDDKVESAPDSKSSNKKNQGNAKPPTDAKTKKDSEKTKTAKRTPKREESVSPTRKQTKKAAAETNSKAKKSGNAKREATAKPATKTNADVKKGKQIKEEVKQDAKQNAKQDAKKESKRRSKAEAEKVEKTDKVSEKVGKAPPAKGDDKKTAAQNEDEDRKKLVPKRKQPARSPARSPPRPAEEVMMVTRSPNRDSATSAVTTVALMKQPATPNKPKMCQAVTIKKARWNDAYVTKAADRSAERHAEKRRREMERVSPTIQAAKEKLAQWKAMVESEDGSSTSAASKSTVVTTVTAHRDSDEDDLPLKCLRQEGTSVVEEVKTDGLLVPFKIDAHASLMSRMGAGNMSSVPHKKRPYSTTTTMTTTTTTTTTKVFRKAVNDEAVKRKDPRDVYEFGLSSSDHGMSDDGDARDNNRRVIGKRKVKNKTVDLDEDSDDDLNRPSTSRAGKGKKNSKNKLESDSDDDDDSSPQRNKKSSPESGSDEDAKNKSRLASYWNGPKRHRLASLNAKAKVHVMYSDENLSFVSRAKKVPPAKEREKKVVKGKQARKDTGSKRKQGRRNESSAEDDADDVEESESEDSEPPSPPSTRVLRTGHGIRGVGRNWDVNNLSSSSSSTEISSSDSSSDEDDDDPKQRRRKCSASPASKRRKVGKQAEQKMQLRDMVVSKRMASLNAAAIMQASYCMEKRTTSTTTKEASTTTTTEKKEVTTTTVVAQIPHVRPATAPPIGHHAGQSLAAQSESHQEVAVVSGVNAEGIPPANPEAADKEKLGHDELIEMIATPDGRHHIILNRDDVTITGVYVRKNRTHSHTHSATHAEGVCSIAGLEYRISATSHTSTEATAVTTEVINVAGNGTEGPRINNALVAPTPTPASYTPLVALSSMRPPEGPQGMPPGPGVAPPPGYLVHHGYPPPPPAGPDAVGIFPGPYPEGCPPPYPPAYPDRPTLYHHEPPPGYHQGESGCSGGTRISVKSSKLSNGIYQPAGPLISTAGAPSGLLAPLVTSAGKAGGRGASPPPSAPPSLNRDPPPAENDTARDIASAPNASSATPAVGGTTASSAGSMPPPSHAPPYAYRHPAHHGAYHPPPQPYYSPYPQQQYYGPPGPPAQYPDPCYSNYYHRALYRRHYTYLAPGPAGSVAPPPGADPYAAPGASALAVPPSPVNAAGGAPLGSVHQMQMVVSTGPPAPGAPPTAHVAPLDYPPVDPYLHYPAYQPPGPETATFRCPCPMQSCPKNVHTGPLTGDGKGPNKQMQPLALTMPPVNLALPQEPQTYGPPSPARGSAGMPPPPSPAVGAAHRYQGWDSLDGPETGPETAPAKAEVGVVKQDPGTPPEATREPPALVLATRHNLIRQNVPPHEQAADSTPSVSDVKVEAEKDKDKEADAVHKDVKDVKDIKDVKDVKAVAVAYITTTVTTTTIEEATQTTPPPETAVILMDKRAASLCTDEPPNKKKKNAGKKAEDGVVVSKTKPSGKSKKLSGKEGLEVEQLAQLAQLAVVGPVNMTVAAANTTTASKAKGSRKTANTTPSSSGSNDAPATPCASTPGRKGSEGKSRAHKRTSSLDSNKSTSSTKSTKRSKSQDKPANNNNTSSTNNNKNRSRSTSRSRIQAEEEEAARVIAAAELPEGVPINQCRRLIAAQKKLILRCEAKKERERQRLAKQEAARAARLAALVSAAEAKKSTPSASTTPVREAGDANADGEKQAIDTVASRLALPAAGSTAAASTLRSPMTVSVSKHHHGHHHNNNDTALDRARVEELGRRAALDIPACLTISQSELRLLESCAEPKTPKWSNGWQWRGQPYLHRVFLNCDDPPVLRKCYPAMQHEEGDNITLGDTILLKSGTRKIDLPFVARVIHLWENPEDGEMMLSLVWFYRPEHTEQGRRPCDRDDEIFSSRHKDINSVACIEDKCYVLTFNEYCRYRKTIRRLEEGLSPPSLIVPSPDGKYPRHHRLPPGHVAHDMVFFCRRIYDFRQRRLQKNVL